MTIQINNNSSKLTRMIKVNNFDEGNKIIARVKTVFNYLDFSNSPLENSI